MSLLQIAELQGQIKRRDARIAELESANTPNQLCADWLPTPENINALPLPVRSYIHQIEAQGDPAGMVRENMQLKDVNRELQTMYRKAVDSQPTSAVVQETLSKIVLKILLSGDLESALFRSGEHENYRIALYNFRTGYTHPPTPGAVAPVAQPRERETDFQIALVKELAEVKQSLLATQGQLETSQMMLGTCHRELHADFAATPPPVAGDARMLLIESLVASKGWNYGYAAAFVDDWFHARVAATASQKGAV